MKKRTILVCAAFGSLALMSILTVSIFSVLSGKQDHLGPIASADMSHVWGGGEGTGCDHTQGCTGITILCEPGSATGPVQRTSISYKGPISYLTYPTNKQVPNPTVSARCWEEVLCVPIASTYPHYKCDSTTGTCILGGSGCVPYSIVGPLTNGNYRDVTKGGCLDP